MLQATALASTRFTRFVFKKPAERFIRIVLDVLSQDLQPPACRPVPGRASAYASDHEKLFYPSSCFFRPKWPVDFNGYADKVRQFPRERAKRREDASEWKRWRLDDRAMPTRPRLT